MCDPCIYSQVCIHPDVHPNWGICARYARCLALLFDTARLCPHIDLYPPGSFLCHSWWRHQMETFPRYWPFVRGIHRSPVNSPHKGQWRGALMISLISIKVWVNSREAGDLRRYRAHYDVTVMCAILRLLQYQWDNTDDYGQKISRSCFCFLFVCLFCYCCFVFVFCFFVFKEKRNQNAKQYTTKPFVNFMWYTWDLIYGVVCNFAPSCSDKNHRP